MAVNLQITNEIAAFMTRKLLRACGTLILLIPLCSLLTAQTAYTHWVNPFIGTGGHGHTFPGATTPFGMVQLSPDTRGADWDGSSGYHYSDAVIYGFSHTHLSGTGIPDYCDILLMPTVDSTKEFGRSISYKGGTYSGLSSTFSHSDERAEPGYYSVRLDDGKLLAELTSTPHVGLHRYTFPRSKNAGINIDLDWRDKLLDSEFKVLRNGRIEGFRRSSSWAKDQKIFFVIQVSKQFGYGCGSGNGMSTSNSGVSETKASDCQRGAFLGFGTSTNEQILVKVALSPVSIEGARKNLAAEMPGWNFDKVRADAKSAWNKELSKIEVSGGTDAQTTTFYTALYHTMIQPNIFEDVDGSYRGHDGKIHNIYGNADTHVRTEGRPGPNAPRSDQPRGGSMGSPDEPAIADKSVRVPSHEYTVFSLWDTFRAAHPLYTIIDQKRTVDFINTFIRQYEQGGRLPVWELAGNETDCMIGYHAVSVIADAMAKGIKGFDYEKAYEASKHSTELDREGLAAYKRRGYISMEDTNESVSKTLEYAYDDWCIAQMARALLHQRSQQIHRTWQIPPGDKEYVDRLNEEITIFTRRSRSFENLFDSKTGFFRPKKNGGFVEPFAPNEVTFGFTEGNSWQYSFFVPQDIPKLMELMGGSRKFATKLDELFTTDERLAGREQVDLTGLIGQYAHGNEPSHHIAYLYNYAGEFWKTQNADQSWKTQRYVRKIIDEFYKPTPDGLIGNEDCGQMSAWYVLSASGFYPVTPGRAAYDIGTPLFPKVKYNLENGKTFTIKAPKVSATNKYVKSIMLNGTPHTWTTINHDQIMNGGILEFEMSDKPSDGGLRVLDISSDLQTVAVPVIGDGRRTFQKSLTISMQTITPNSQIYYTLDGSEPSEKSTPYTAPVTINSTTTVKAIAINAQKVRSQVAEATYNLIPNDWSVKIDSKYNRQYTGGGDEGLIDGIRGTTSFASGEWQGYQGQDFVATIDLKKTTTVSEVGGGFLQNAGSWIWMPTHIAFEASPDGVNFTKVADVRSDVAVTDMGSKIRDYTAKISPVTARYVRVHAYNLGKVPAWHPGAGSDAFIFVDEIWVK